MLTEYINAAMRHIVYEPLEDGTIFAHSTALEGPWANEPTREQAEVELRSAIEDWIVVSIARHDPLPTIDGITLAIPAIV